MSDKFILLHPDDYDRAQAEGLPVEGDFGIPLVRDNFGACKPGHGFEVSPSPYRWKASLKIQDTFVEQVSRFNYLPLRLPDPKKLIIGVDWATDVVRRVPRLLSLKKRAKGQRRLDFSSNVRRRKRWAELRARKR